MLGCLLRTIKLAHAAKLRIEYPDEPVINYMFEFVCQGYTAVLLAVLGVELDLPVVILPGGHTRQNETPGESDPEGG